MVGVASLFTFIFIISPAYGQMYALESGTNPLNASALTSSNVKNPIYEEEKQKRVSLILDYLRSEAPHFIPTLPDAMRIPTRWAMDGLTSLRDEFGSIHEGFGLRGADFGAGEAVNEVVRPIASLMHSPDESAAQAIWVSAGYHHKGFLPTHDALIINFNTRHRSIGSNLEFSTKPFIGQNWHSAENYWGIETTLNIGQHAKKGTTNDHMHGKIVMRYTNGSSELMNNDRGLDMHAEFDFTNHLSLQAGIRSGSSSDNNNYVMMRWKLAEFDK